MTWSSSFGPRHAASLSPPTCRPTLTAAGWPGSQRDLRSHGLSLPTPSNRLPLHFPGMAPNSVRLTSSDSLPEHLLLLQSELKRQQGNDFYQPNWGTHAPFCGQGTRNWWTRPTRSTRMGPLKKTKPKAALTCSGQLGHAISRQ